MFNCDIYQPLLQGVAIPTISDAIQGFHQAQEHPCAPEMMAAAQMIWEAYVGAMKAGMGGVMKIWRSSKSNLEIDRKVTSEEKHGLLFLPFRGSVFLGQGFIHCPYFPIVFHFLCF